MKNQPKTVIQTLTKEANLWPIGVRWMTLF
jgi:hypothetical protein